MIKIQEDLGIQGAYLNTEKTIYNNPTAKIIQNEEKLKAFATNQEYFLYSCSTQCLNYYLKESWEKEIQGYK